VREFWIHTDIFMLLAKYTVPRGKQLQLKHFTPLCNNMLQEKRLEEKFCSERLGRVIVKYYYRMVRNFHEAKAVKILIVSR
jgi:hypothetical protein